MELKILPQILTYDQGTVFITAEAMSIPELKAIIDKFGETDCIPYLGYVHLMTWLLSPYRSYEESERKENVVYDVISTMGDFDIDEPLLEPAMEKLTEMNTTPLTLFFMEVEEELHRMRKYLRSTPISGGKEGDLAERFRILKEAGAITASYNKAKASAEEELKVKGRGKAKIGDYN